MDSVPIHHSLRFVSLARLSRLTRSVFLVGCIAQGWCLQAPAPLGVTIFVGFFVGLGSSTVNIGQSITRFGSCLLTSQLKYTVKISCPDKVVLFRHQ